MLNLSKNGINILAPDGAELLYSNISTPGVGIYRRVKPRAQAPWAIPTHQTQGTSALGYSNFNPPGCFAKTIFKL